MAQGRKAFLARGPEGGVRLTLVLWIWIVLATAFFAMMTFSSLSIRVAINNQRSITERTVRCYKLADRFQSGSDNLTYAAWRFAAAGNPADAEEYLEEVNVTRSRDEAIQKLLQEGVGERKLAYMLEAKRLSNKLMDKELWAIRMIYEANGLSPMPEAIAAVQLSEEELALSAQEKRERVNAFLFGEDYESLKEGILLNIKLFHDRLNESLSTELMAAMEETSLAQKRQLFFDYVFIAWLFVLLAFLRLWLMKPVRDYSAILSFSPPDPTAYPTVNPSGAYETRHLGVVFNAVLSKLKDVTNMLEQRNHELTVLSNTDYLTKVSNRLSMEEALVSMLDHCRERDGVSIGFLMLDLDHFKAYNDAYGHPAGDEALRGVACLLKEMTEEKKGIVARIGGEEFFLILPDVSETALAAFAKSILERVRASRFGGHSVTLSIGGYLWRGGPESPKEMYVRADKALYQAKELGRDRYAAYRE